MPGMLPAPCPGREAAVRALLPSFSSPSSQRGRPSPGSQECCSGMSRSIPAATWPEPSSRSDPGASPHPRPRLGWPSVTDPPGHHRGEQGWGSPTSLPTGSRECQRQGAAFEVGSVRCSWTEGRVPGVTPFGGASKGSPSSNIPLHWGTLTALEAAGGCGASQAVDPSSSSRRCFPGRGGEGGARPSTDLPARPCVSFPA